MKRFEVSFRETEYCYVIIEAKNKDDARELAVNALNNGDAIYGDCDSEITKIEEIKK